MRDTPPRLSVHGAPSAFVRRVDWQQGHSGLAVAPPTVFRSLPDTSHITASVFRAEERAQGEHVPSVSADAEVEADHVSATPYEVSLAQREEKWLSGVAELLRCADELALGGGSQELMCTSSAPSSLGAPGATARQRKLEEVLQRRLKSLRFLAQQQAMLGSQLDSQSAGMPDEEREVVEMRRWLSDEAEILNQRVSILAEAQACLADAEQRCEQEAHTRKMMLQQRQDEIEECSNALENVEGLYGVQAALLADMRRKLVESEQEAECLLKERMALDMRRQEIDMRETCLKCMEAAWEVVVDTWSLTSSHGTAPSRKEVQAFGAENLASALLRNEPYLRRLNHLVDTVVNSSAVSIAPTIIASAIVGDGNLEIADEAHHGDCEKVDDESELQEHSSLQWEVSTQKQIPSMERQEENLNGFGSSALYSIPNSARLSEADSTIADMVPRQPPASAESSHNAILNDSTVTRFSTQPVQSSTPGTPGPCSEQPLGQLSPQSPAHGRIPQQATTPAPAPPRRSTSAPPCGIAKAVAKLVNPVPIVNAVNAVNRSASPTPGSLATGSLLAPRTSNGSPQKSTRSSLLMEELPNHPPMSPPPGYGKLASCVAPTVSRASAISNSRSMAMSPSSMSPRPESPGGWRTTGGIGTSMSAFRHSLSNAIAVEGTPRPAPQPWIGIGTTPVAASVKSPSNLASSSSQCRALSPSPRAAFYQPSKLGRQVSHQLAGATSSTSSSANPPSQYSAQTLPSGLSTSVLGAEIGVRRPTASTPGPGPESVRRQPTASTSIPGAETGVRQPTASTPRRLVGASNLSPAYASLQNIGFGSPASCYPSQSTFSSGALNGMNGASLQMRLVTVSSLRT